MKVNVLNATDHPIWVISKAAGTCYGKNDISLKRAKNCFKAGHLSVFEHAYITFEIEGISRACSHQLVRHRLASFCQQSQRYCEIDVAKTNWYVVPEVFRKDMTTHLQYAADMYKYGTAYKEALNNGVKPEDARYLLPEACKTTLTMSMNVRELFHILDMRMDKAAQWEIRELATKLHDKARDYDHEWAELIDIYDGKVE